MDKERPVIEYGYQNNRRGRAIRVYAGGSVEYIDIDIFKGWNETLKTVSISPDKVREYAERLEQLGFFNLKNKHVKASTSELNEQLKKKLTLRYKGRSNEVTYSSYHPPSPEIAGLAHELFELVE